MAIAAVSVIERAGFRVVVPQENLCCGRPLYDQGMLSRARRNLNRIIAVLAPYAQRGVPIIGLEPSCILTFRDELPGLFPHNDDARALAAVALTFGEFIARHAPVITPPPAVDRVLLHGHCHQKSLAGLDSEIAVLRRRRDLRLEVPDAGCCGMAGAFGYAPEHYEISRMIGERVLIPAILKSQFNTAIVADGFACRTQIRQFCPGRTPYHLAQLLNDV